MRPACDNSGSANWYLAHDNSTFEFYGEVVIDDSGDGHIYLGAAGTGMSDFMKASGTQTLNTNVSIARLTHSGAGTLQLASSLTITASLDNDDGIIDLNGQTWTMTGATFSNAGTIKLQGGETINNLTQDATQGTWEYVGDGAGGSGRGAKGVERVESGDGADLASRFARAPD